MMKRQNRILSLLLSLLLVLGICAPVMQWISIPVLAAGGKPAMMLALPRPDWSASNRKGWGHGALKLSNGWSMDANAGTIYVLSLDTRSSQVAYCIAPGASLHSGDLLNENDEKYLDQVADINLSLDRDKLKELLGRVMTYGYQGNLNPHWNITNNSHKDQMVWLLATQQLVWEVVIGERDPNFKKISGGGTPISNRYTSSHPLKSKINEKVKEMEEKIKKHGAIPSFMVRKESAAKTVNLQWNASQRQFTATLTDTNKVTDKFKYTASGVTCTVEGNNKLKLTSPRQVNNVTIKAERKTQQKRATSVIFGSGSSFGPNVKPQPMIRVGKLIDDPVPGYLKVKSGAEPDVPDTGLVKTSEDGKVANRTFLVSGTYEEQIATWNATTQQYDYTWVGRTFSKTYTTDSDGNAKLDGMPADTATNPIRNENYTVKETGTPPKYKQPPDQTFSYGAKIEFYNELKRGGFRLEKVDSDFGQAGKPQGNGSLAGAEFELYNAGSDVVVVDDAIYEPGELVMTLTTDDNGVIETAKDALSYGSYRLKEVEASEGYLVGGEKTFSITSDNQWHTFNGASGVLETIARGGFVLQKVDSVYKEPGKPQGDATLAGAKFEIINNSANPVMVGGTTYGVGQVCMTVTTDANGRASGSGLPYGSYTARESAQSSGYLLNSNWSASFDIYEDGVIVDLGEVACPEEVIRGGVEILKQDNDYRTKEKNQGDATFQGAWIEIVNISPHSVFIYDQDVPNYGDGKQKDALPSDDEESSDDDDPDPAEEESGEPILPPNGRAGRSVKGSLTLTKVDEDNEAEKLPGAVFSLFKKDDTPIPNPNNSNKNEYVTDQKGQLIIPDLDLGDYYIVEIKPPAGYELGAVTRHQVSIESTDGAWLTVTNQKTPDPEDLIGDDEREPIPPEVFKGGEVKPGEVVMMLMTDEKGWAGTNAHALPYGTYQMREVNPSTGYLIDTTWQPTFEVRENGKIVNVGATKPINEPIIRGGVKIRKVDNDYKEEEQPQGDGTLAGAVFAIRNDSKHSVFVKGKEYAIGETCLTITTDVKGVAISGAYDLPYGSYSMTEIDPSTGYLIDEGWNPSFKIREQGVYIDMTSDPTRWVEEPVIRGGVKIRKWDNDYRTSEKLQGDAVFDGAKFEITNKSKEKVYVRGESYDPGEVVLTITTDTKGIATTFANDLPYGTYSMLEVDPSTGYLLDKAWNPTFVIRQQGLIVDLTPETLQAQGKHPVNEPIIRGGVKIRKWDHDYRVSEKLQGDAIFEGAKFTITNESDHSVWVQNEKKQGFQEYGVGEVVYTLTTGEKGVDQTLANTLPYGTYSLKEVHPSEGYLMDEEWNPTIYIREEGVMVDITPETKRPDTWGAHPVNEPIIRGGVKIRKWDNDYRTSEKLQGDAVFEGAKFEIINKSDHSVWVDNGDGNGHQEYAVGEVCYTLTTEEKGLAWTAIDTLPYGTYSIKEMHPSMGYLLDKDWNPTFVIREDGLMVDLTPETLQAQGKHPVNEPIIRGGVKIRKMDEDFKITEKPQGDATLAGAKIEITNESDHSVWVQNELQAGFAEYQVGEVCYTLTTEEKGGAQTLTNTLPYGTYSAKEVHPSEGYRIDEAWNPTFTIREEGVIVDLTERDPIFEPIIRGDVQLEKWDLELDKPEALGGANHGNNRTGTHLEGIEFTLVNKSLHPVYVDGEEFAVGDVVKVLTTAWNEKKKSYTCQTMGKALPYGTYTLQETQTNDSYLLTDGKPRTFSIREDGVTVTVDTAGNELVWKNQVVRGDVKIVKIAEKTSKRLQVPFAIKNVTTGEEHVFLTDRNGEWQSSSSFWNRHSRNTNGNDYALEELKKDPNTVLKTKDLDPKAGIWFGLGENGSMATVNDNLGALPYGDYRIQELRSDQNEAYTLQTFEFTVYRNETLVDTGTVTNIAGQPTIKTKAISHETATKQLPAVRNAIILDDVAMTNLQPDTKYKLVTTLADTRQGGDVVAGGVVVKMTTAFETKSGEREKDLRVDLKLDASDLGGKTVVVFQKLMTENGEVVAVHEDLLDLDQTIYVPKIETTATDDEGRKQVEPKGKVTIIDKVWYSNLIVGKEYQVSGVLMVKSTNQPLLVNGKQVTASKKFTPDKVTGEVELKFVIEDASALTGESVVVFERLSLDGIEVATHTDINDEGQTVKFPDPSKPTLKTTATDENGKKEITPKGKVTILDKVEYTNLTVGKEYEVSGVLMVKSTGKPLLINGKEVRSSKKFTPDKPNGTVKLTFVIEDASALAGDAVVAFETLTLDGKEVATHTDINDEGQTVKFPKPKEPSEPPTSSTPNKPKTPDTPSTTTGIRVPKTGDTIPLLAIIGTLGVIITTIGGTVVVVKKRKTKRK